MGDKQPETIEFNTSDGSNGYLSPEYVSRFSHADKNFESREQYINAAKADVFGYPVTFKTIMETTDAMEARRLGTLVAWGLDDDHQWHKDKYRIYLKGDLLKFTTSEHADELRRKLLATGEARLVFTGPDDDKTNPKRGFGENIVGRVLEDVRARLRQENAVVAGTSSVPAPIGGEPEQKRKAQGLKQPEDKERAAKKAKKAQPHLSATDLTTDIQSSTRPSSTRNWAQGYTVQDMKVELKKRGLHGYSGLKKEGLIAMLTADDQPKETVKRRSRNTEPKLQDLANMDDNDLHDLAHQYGLTEREMRVMKRKHIEVECHGLILEVDYRSEPVPYEKWPKKYMIDELEERQCEKAPEPEKRLHLIKLLKNHDDWRRTFTDVTVLDREHSTEGN